MVAPETQAALRDSIELGKQRLEIDWDTGEVVDLDPILQRLLERLASTARLEAGNHEAGCSWTKPCTCGAARLAQRAAYVLKRGGIMAGSGEFNSSGLLWVLNDT